MDLTYLFSRSLDRRRTGRDIDLFAPGEVDYQGEALFGGAGFLIPRSFCAHFSKVGKVSVGVDTGRGRDGVVVEYRHQFKDVVFNGHGGLELDTPLGVEITLEFLYRLCDHSSEGFVGSELIPFFVADPVPFLDVFRRTETGRKFQCDLCAQVLKSKLDAVGCDV